jgi:hypothetical protein
MEFSLIKALGVDQFNQRVISRVFRDGNGAGAKLDAAERRRSASGNRDDGGDLSC